MLSTAAFTFFCSSGVFCSGRFFFASSSCSMVALSTGSVASDLSGLLHSSENVVSTLIASSDFLPCTTSAYTASKSSRTSFPLVLIVSRSRSRFRMARLKSSFLWAHFCWRKNQAFRTSPSNPGSSLRRSFGTASQVLQSFARFASAVFLCLS